MESESSTENTTNQGTEGSKKPSIALDTTLGVLASDDHNAILNNVSKPKKKRRKRQKKNTPSDAPKKRKKRKTKSTKAVSKTNLKALSNENTDVVAGNTVKRLQTPRKTDDSTVGSDLTGSEMMIPNQKVPTDVLGAGQTESQYAIHDEQDEVPSIDAKVNIAWEHFSLLIEEYLLCIDVKM